MRAVRTLFVLVAATALLGGCAWIEQSSVSSGPRPVRGNAASGQPSASQSGRWVAFSSAADNLVPGDTNGVTDVFVHDHVRDVTERISIATGGAQGDGPSSHPKISDDGRFVVFQTDASTLSDLPSPVESRNHLYLRDRQLGITTRIDRGPYVNGYESGYFLPAISGNGRFLAFVVEVTYENGRPLRFVPYVRDLLTGGVKEIAPYVLDGSYLFPDIGPSLSDDGSRLVYGTVDYGLYLPPGYFQIEVIVADTATGSPIDAVYSELTPTDATSIPRVEATISGDGSTVVRAVTIDGVATISRLDVGVPGLVAVHTGVTDPRGLALSDDGRVLGFSRSSQYVVSTNGATPRVVGADRRGRAVAATAGDLSGDGRWVAFSSPDALVRGDVNGVDDVFLRSARPS